MNATNLNLLNWNFFYLENKDEGEDWLSLPAEIIQYIGCFLDAKDFYSAILTCWSWNEGFNQEPVWKELFGRAGLLNEDVKELERLHKNLIEQQELISGIVQLSEEYEKLMNKLIPVNKNVSNRVARRIFQKKKRENKEKKEKNFKTTEKLKEIEEQYKTIHSKIDKTQEDYVRYIIGPKKYDSIPHLRDIPPEEYTNKTKERREISIENVKYLLDINKIISETHPILKGCTPKGKLFVIVQFTIDDCTVEGKLFKRYPTNLFINVGVINDIGHRHHGTQYFNHGKHLMRSPFKERLRELIHYGQVTVEDVNMLGKVTRTHTLRLGYKKEISFE